MYTKLTDLQNKITSLIYFNCDFVHPTRLGHGRTLQRCEDKEHKEKFFNRLIYNFGNDTCIKKYLVIDFDFENSKVTIGKKSFTVIPDYEYTYKRSRSNILAIDGIKGFYSHLVYCMEYDSALCYYTLGVLERIFKTKAIEVIKAD